MSQPLNSSGIINVLFIWTFYWRFVSLCLAARSALCCWCDAGYRPPSCLLAAPPSVWLSPASADFKRFSMELSEGPERSDRALVTAERCQLAPGGWRMTMQYLGVTLTRSSVKLKVWLKIRWWRVCGWCFHTHTHLTAFDHLILFNFMWQSI